MNPFWLIFFNPGWFNHQPETNFLIHFPQKLLGSLAEVWSQRSSHNIQVTLQIGTDVEAIFLTVAHLKKNVGDMSPFQKWEKQFFNQMSHEKKSGGPLLSIESWLFNDGILIIIIVYCNPHITG